jgi:hypothetical protein
LTYKPSIDPSNINATEKTTRTIAVWVAHPLDDSRQPDDRGGEEAVRLVRVQAAGDWLGLIACSVDVEMQESMILNQPKRAVNELGLRPASAPLVDLSTR